MTVRTPIPSHTSYTNHNSNIEYNQSSRLLFVEIHQIFSLFFVPFYKSNVHLTTKLQLAPNPTDPDDKKYYIASQEDLYQLNEVVKFFWPGGATVIWLWQMMATAMCVLGALTLAPVTWLEQRRANRRVGVNGGKKML